MHETFIAMSGSIYGVWGVGPTIERAEANLRKAGGVKSNRVYRFASELPFAPRDRDATAEEADCWIGRDGSMSWTRCEKTIVS